MRNRKNIATEEPLWKKRRREEQLQTRKSRQWIAVVVIILAVAVSFMIYGVIKSLHSSPKSKIANEPRHTVALIADKVMEQSTGKPEMFIVFRVEGKMMRKSVDQATFNSLEKGQKVLLTFDADLMGRPKNIRGWSRLKLAKPVE